MEEKCGPEMRRWRTSEGECNNLQQPSWGRSHTAYVRLVAPLYSDSSLGFRRSSDGSELPSARAVSDRLAGRGDGSDGGGGSELSGHSMQWGQFLTHDLDHTPEQAPPHVTDCCGEESDHPACAPITIPPTDSLYSLHNKTCINFLRSSLASTSACMVDQQNQVTSYIDGSMVYGSKQKTLQDLRELQGGRLNLTRGKLSSRSLETEETQTLQTLCCSPAREESAHREQNIVSSRETGELTSTRASLSTTRSGTGNTTGSPPVSPSSTPPGGTTSCSRRRETFS